MEGEEDDILREDGVAGIGARKRARRGSERFAQGCETGVAREGGTFRGGRESAEDGANTIGIDGAESDVLFGPCTASCETVFMAALAQHLSVVAIDATAPFRVICPELSCGAVVSPCALVAHMTSKNLPALFACKLVEDEVRFVSLQARAFCAAQERRRLEESADKAPLLSPVFSTVTFTPPGVGAVNAGESGKEGMVPLKREDPMEGVDAQSLHPGSYGGGVGIDCEMLDPSLQSENYKYLELIGSDRVRCPVKSCGVIVKRMSLRGHILKSVALHPGGRSSLSDNLYAEVRLLHNSSSNTRKHRVHEKVMAPIAPSRPAEVISPLVITGSNEGYKLLELVGSDRARCPVKCCGVVLKRTSLRGHVLRGSKLHPGGRSDVSDELFTELGRLHSSACLKLRHAAAEDGEPRGSKMNAVFDGTKKKRIRPKSLGDTCNSEAGADIDNGRRSVFENGMAQGRNFAESRPENQHFQYRTPTAGQSGQPHLVPVDRREKKRPRKATSLDAHVVSCGSNSSQDDCEGELGPGATGYADGNASFSSPGLASQHRADVGCVSCPVPGCPRLILLSQLQDHVFSIDCRPVSSIPSESKAAVNMLLQALR